MATFLFHFCQPISCIQLRPHTNFYLRSRQRQTCLGSGVSCINLEPTQYETTLLKLSKATSVENSTIKCAIRSQGTVAGEQPPAPGGKVCAHVSQQSGEFHKQVPWRSIRAHLQHVTVSSVLDLTNIVALPAHSLLEFIHTCFTVWLFSYQYSVRCSSDICFSRPVSMVWALHLSVQFVFYCLLYASIPWPIYLLDM